MKKIFSLVFALNISASNVGTGIFEKDCAGLKTQWGSVMDSVRKLNALGKTLNKANEDAANRNAAIKAKSLFDAEMSKIANMKVSAPDICTSIFAHGLLNQYKKLEQRYDQFAKENKSTLANTFESNGSGKFNDDCKQLNSYWSNQYYIIQGQYTLLRNVLEEAKSANTETTARRVRQHYAVFSRLEPEINDLKNRGSLCEILYVDGLRKSFKDLKAEYEKLIPADLLEILKKKARF